MKKEYFTAKNIILSIVMSIVGVGLPFLVYGIIFWVNGNKFPYYILHVIFIFLFGLFSYVSGDIILVKYKKQIGEINPIYPEEITLKANKIRTPFIISLIVTLLVLSILFIIYLISKSWPLL